MLQEKDKQLAEKDRQLEEKDKQLAEKDRQLKEKDRQLEEKDRQFEVMIRKWQETAVRNQQEVLRQLHERDVMIKQRAERWNKIACSVRREQALASGSWGIVHKGTLPVAIKELKAITPESLKLFQREIDAAFFCHHPNIVEFLGATNNLHHGAYIVMELMDGNLRDFIKHENYQLPQKIIVSFALDIAKGLSYLHGNNPPTLHRDLKTDNILLKSGTAKIGDLGSAKVQQDSMTPYRGTLHYTAPEVLSSNIQTPKVSNTFLVSSPSLYFLSFFFLFRIVLSFSLLKWHSPSRILLSPDGNTHQGQMILQPRLL